MITVCSHFFSDVFSARVGFFALNRCFLSFLGRRASAIERGSIRVFRRSLTVPEKLRALENVSSELRDVEVEASTSTPHLKRETTSLLAILGHLETLDTTVQSLVSNVAPFLALTLRGRRLEWRRLAPETPLGLAGFCQTLQGPLRATMATVKGALEFLATAKSQDCRRTAAMAKWDTVFMCLGEKKRIARFREALLRRSTRPRQPPTNRVYCLSVMSSKEKTIKVDSSQSPST